MSRGKYQFRCQFRYAQFYLFAIEIEIPSLFLCFLPTRGLNLYILIENNKNCLIFFCFTKNESVTVSVKSEK